MTTGIALLLANKPPAAGVTNKLVTSFTPGAGRQSFSGGVGLLFTLSANNTFNMLGYRCGSGPLPTAQRFRLFNATTGTDLATTTANLTGQVLGTFYYVAISSVTLVAGTRYCMWAEAFSGNGYLWADSGPTTLRASTSWNGGYNSGNFATGLPTSGSVSQQFYGLDLGFA